jgi:hypothetical protein
MTNSSKNKTAIQILDIPKNTLLEMNKAFDEIQMPRSPYQLNSLVVRAKYTPEMQYSQCVLEMSIAYDNLRTARYKARIKEIQIEDAPTETETQRCKKEIKLIELEQLNRARLGALREFEVLYSMWQAMPVKYTREQINAAQENEYLLRLETQAQFDLNASGHVSPGNQEGLRQIGRIPTPHLLTAEEIKQLK